VLIWKIRGDFPAEFCIFNGSCVRHATAHTHQRYLQAEKPAAQTAHLFFQRKIQRKK
jgi:hypothetical protein